LNSAASLCSQITATEPEEVLVIEEPPKVEEEKPKEPEKPPVSANIYAPGTCIFIALLLCRSLPRSQW
jgi:hypothetical protein